jgi:hypothetical protein
MTEEQVDEVSRCLIDSIRAQVSRKRSVAGGFSVPETSRIPALG